MNRTFSHRPADTIPALTDTCSDTLLKFLPGPWDVEKHPDTPGALVIMQFVQLNRWAQEGYDISAKEGDRRGAEEKEYYLGNRVLVKHASSMYQLLCRLCSDPEGALEDVKKLIREMR